MEFRMKFPREEMNTPIYYQCQRMSLQFQLIYDIIPWDFHSTGYVQVI